MMLNENESQDWDDAPACCVKKHTQDVGEQRKSDPVLEWLRYENEKVYQSCNKRESKVGEEEPKDRMSNFNAKVHAMDTKRQEDDV